MKPKISDGYILRRVANQAKPYWWHLFGIFLLSLLATPLSLLLPLPLKIVVDNVIGSRPLPNYIMIFLPEGTDVSSPLLLGMAAGLLVGVTFLSQLQGLGSWLLQAYVGERMVLDFRAKLFGHVQKLSLAYHDTKSAADSAYRIHYDAPSLQHITIYGFVPLIAAISSLVGMVFIAARLDVTLALIALGVMPVLLALMHVFRGPLRNRWTNVKNFESSANSVVHEVLSSLRVVKAFGREEYEQSRFWHHATRQARELLRVSFLQGGYDLLVSVIVAFGTAIVLYVGALHVRNGVISLGDLLLVIAYIGQLYEPLKVISNKLATLQGGLASVERAFALLDEEPDVVEQPHARSIVRSCGSIRFENVCFGYAGGTPVLMDVNFEAPPGSRVGIEGKTGSGKSTLMSLLTRFYDVSGGRILLDGIDIREYKLADYRDQFAIVLQDPVLFSTTVAENIAYGCPGAAESQIVEAARLANAHEFISKLPNGYETTVGERGMRLSGGERQRISLARAFLKNAPILILDEPTSSVDEGTEAIIIDALQRLMEKRTTFMIAHRLGTLQSCDIRLELRDGRLNHLTPCPN